MQPAALTLLVGVGEVGQRVAGRASERLEREALARAGGVKLLVMGADGPALRDAIRESVLELTRQRTVAAVEKRYAIRRPSGRYLRLQIVCVAALSEVKIQLLRECVQVIQGLKHPAPGLQLLFVLDATHPRDPGEVAPEALAALEALQAELRAFQARGRRDWSSTPSFRCFLAHPHRADGSRLSRGARVPGARCQVPGEEGPSLPGTWHLAPGIGERSDEYEATLAAAVAGHIAPGPLHDSLAPTIEPDPDDPPFALLGWASDVFPREMLLDRAAQSLAADLLERTASGGVPGAGCQVPGGEELLSPGTWHLAPGTASEASLLDRRHLLIRLLSPDVEESPIQVDAEPDAPRLSFYQRLMERVWGRPAAPDPSVRPLRVRLELRAGAWRAGDPRRWPAELLALDARGAQEFDAAVRLLQDQHLAQQTVDELIDAFGRSADLCVRHHLGGVRAARELIEQALGETERRVRQAEAIPFGEPDAPRDLGLPAGAGLEEAWRAFRLRCERLPGWPAVLARGLAFGALGVTACFALGEDVHEVGRLFLGWAGVAVSVAAAVLWYGGALDRLNRLGEYVAECVRARYGRRLMEYAQLAAGTPTRDGVYQAIARHFRDVEIPALERFDAVRQDLIGQMRRNAPFSPAEGTTDLLADASEADDLYRSARQGDSDPCLTDEAHELLADHDLFAGWRAPEPDRLLATASAYARQRHLLPWERKPLGDFLRDLTRLHTPPERLDEVFVALVAERMDHLVLRSVPLAPGPFGAGVDEARSAEHGAGTRQDALPQPALRASCSALRAGSEATITLAVPASLSWHDGEAAGAGVPADSNAGSLATWFGRSPNAVRLRLDEDDIAACVVTLGGLTPAAALQALGTEEALGSRLSALGGAGGGQPLDPLAASDSEAAPSSQAESREPRAESRRSEATT